MSPPTTPLTQPEVQTPGTTPAGGVVARVAQFAELGQTVAGAPLASLDHLLEVAVTVTAELGRVSRPIAEVLKLGPGAVVDLEKPVSEPVDLYIQGTRVARGEVVVVDDRFAVRITHLTDNKRR